MTNLQSARLSITRPNYGQRSEASTHKTLTFLFLLFTITMTMATAPSQAQTHTVLHSFDWTDGADPKAGLVEGVDGNLYGTATYGGAAGNCQYSCAGTIFEITAGGSYRLLYQFCSLANCADGLYPYANLLQAANGNLYGTTTGGGAYGAGTVFEITPAGRLTTIYSFCARKACADGATPTAALIEGTDHNFYGTTFSGGRYSGGSVFKLTTSGKLFTLTVFARWQTAPMGNGLMADWYKAVMATSTEPRTSGAPSIPRYVARVAVLSLKSLRRAR